jgi:hypothetical protein
MDNFSKEKAAKASSSAERLDSDKEPGRRKGSNKEKLLMLNTVRTKKKNQSSFLLDSGASSHMSPNRDWFHSLHPIDTREISLGDNSKVNAEAAGVIILKLPYNQGATLRLITSDVLYVPELSLNLLSCSKLTERGVASIFFCKTGCTLIDKNNDDDVLAKAHKKIIFYWLTSAKPELPSEHLSSAKDSEKDEIAKWHNRLAHLNKEKIRQMMRSNQLIPSKETDKPGLDCVSGKQARGSYSGTFEKAEKPGAVIHSDVPGPLPPFLSGCRYFVRFIDEYTRYATAVPMCGAIPSDFN